MTDHLTTPVAIVGAGLAGLVAAHAWPTAAIYEAAPQSTRAGTHRALLRFRSDAVSRLTGIEFRKVLVRKGLFVGGDFREPTIALANAYERKCTGMLLDGARSVWNLAPVERWVAPDDFHAQLVENCAGRIHWARPFPFDAAQRWPIVSTMPLPDLLPLVGVAIDPPVCFHRSSIYVERWKLEDVDLFQTVYFPSTSTRLYRASITGRVLICEFVEKPPPDDNWREEVTRAFRIGGLTWTREGASEQRNGKIVPATDFVRKGLLFRLTHERAIYSLGRFATWRNILLDDVVDDIAVIKRLLRSGAHAGASYDLSKNL